MIISRRRDKLLASWDRSRDRAGPSSNLNRCSATIGCPTWP